MRYLTLWRMQLAARLLADGATKVAAIGEQVGFRSWGTGHASGVILVTTKR
jgi:AraC-like DNA-binding protein